MGGLYVENLANGEDQTVTSLGRGHYRLGLISVGATGMNARCYFQATGKKYIWFISKKPVYTEMTTKSVKKVKLNSGYDINIYPSIDAKNDLNSGIHVRFDSDLDAEHY